MNSRTLVNLLLLTCVVALASFYLHRQSVQDRLERLTPLTVEQIHTITIPRSQSEDIILKKQPHISADKPWQMVQPYSLPAHPFRVRTLLAISQLELDTVYDATQLNLEDYALQPARASMLFNDIEVRFGKTSINGRRYLLSGDKLTLVLDKTYPLVSASANSLVDLNLIPDFRHIDGIETQHFKLYKDQTDRWSIKPENTLNIDQIHTLLEHWKMASAFAVHRYSVRENSATANLLLDGETIHFTVSLQPPWLILGREDTGIEYHMDMSYYKKLISPNDA